MKIDVIGTVDRSGRIIHHHVINLSRRQGNGWRNRKDVPIAA